MVCACICWANWAGKSDWEFYPRRTLAPLFPAFISSRLLSAPLLLMENPFVGKKLKYVKVLTSKQNAPRFILQVLIQTMFSDVVEKLMVAPEKPMTAIDPPVSHDSSSTWGVPKTTGEKLSSDNERSHVTLTVAMLQLSNPQVPPGLATCSLMMTLTWRDCQQTCGELEMSTSATPLESLLNSLFNSSPCINLKSQSPSHVEPCCLPALKVPFKARRCPTRYIQHSADSQGVFQIGCQM